MGFASCSGSGRAGRTRRCLQEEGSVGHRLPQEDAPQLLSHPSGSLLTQLPPHSCASPLYALFRTSPTCGQLRPEDEHPYQEKSSHRLHAAVSLRGASVESWGTWAFKALGRMGGREWDWACADVCTFFLCCCMEFSGDLLHKIHLGLLSCSKSSYSIAQLCPAATPGAEGQAKGRLFGALSPKQAGGSGAAFFWAGMLLQEEPLW